jgi:hypothetical protein
MRAATEEPTARGRTTIINAGPRAAGGDDLWYSCSAWLPTYGVDPEPSFGAARATRSVCAPLASLGFSQGA